MRARTCIALVVVAILLGCGDRKDSRDQDSITDTQHQDSSDMVLDDSDVPLDTQVDPGNDAEDAEDVETEAMDSIDDGQDAIEDPTDAGDASLDVPTDADLDSTMDASADTPADTLLDTTVDPMMDTAADTTVDTGTDTVADLVEEETVIACVGLGGVCVATGTCTSCPVDHVPASNERECGSGSWCCLPTSSSASACEAAGGACIPDLLGTTCAPGWSFSSTSCGDFFLRCCEEDPGC